MPRCVAPLFLRRILPATAGACVRALLRAGAASVAILCWARVIDRDRDGGD